ncbi:MAG: DNA polymerase I [Candidatus Binatia bacterium]
MSLGTVYLLDTSFFIFRAYHALPPLTTSKGIPTGAVHGVSTMLEKLIRDRKPVLMGACFDTARATFRRDLYPAYKANRLEPDEDLRVQFPYVRRLIDALEIPVLDFNGYEADDILATLAKRYEDAGYEVVLVTGDKDLMQCVTDRTTIMDPMRDLVIGREQVREKFGVGPEAVAEVLGLMGDTSDNIPGVRGVGPKTASALIAHFGTVEELLARTAEIETLPIRGAASVRRKIEEGAEMARLCRRLAEVCRDVPIEVDPTRLQLGRLATEDLTALADELEMHRLVGRMATLAGDMGFAPHPVREEKPVPPTAGAAATRRPGATSGQQQEFVMGTRAATETAPAAAPDEDFADIVAAFSGDRLLVASSEQPGASWLVAIGDGCRVATAADRDAIVAAFLSLAGRSLSLVGHDLKALCREFGAVPGSVGFDLGVASYLCDPEAGDHSFEDVCRRFLGEEAAEPATGVGALAQVQKAAEILQAQLEGRELDSLYRKLEHPLIAILGSLEAHGVLLDREALAAMSVDLESRMSLLVEKVYEAAGSRFNILSPIQLRDVLFDKLALPSKGMKKTKTGLSTDSEALESLAALHPLPALVLEYRAMAKLKSTYVDSLPRLADEAGRVHTRLHQTVAATGRLSSSDPNLQNIPVRTEEGAKIRGAFIAAPGARLISADYNQIELRVLAHLSADENLIEAFRSGQDIHAATSADMFEVPLSEVTPSMRREAKVVNYGIIYGMGPQRLSRELGITRVKAEEYIKRYFEKFPRVQGFYSSMLEHARDKGYVATLMGRRRYLPDITSDHGGRRQLAERVATNTPIQGSAADIIKTAMVDLDAALRECELASRLVLQIHDELLLEAPVPEVEEVSRLVVRIMEGAVRLLVPVVVDVGSGVSWAEAH